MKLIKVNKFEYFNIESITKIRVEAQYLHIWTAASGRTSYVTIEKGSGYY